jgi:F0F1-type ATP synthase membrane subunit b/b'
MQQESERIRQETAAQIARLEQKAEQEIESAGKTARRELKNYAAKLALDLAEQRVRTRLDAHTEQAMIDGFLEDLERQDAQNTESKS